MDTKWTVETKGNKNVCDHAHTQLERKIVYQILELRRDLRNEY